jgi:5-methylcytosine-specific restriction endonuclease McrA
MKKNNSGKNNNNYKDGRTLKKYYCKICKKKEVSWRHFLYRSGLCLKCSRIGIGNPNYKHGKTLEQNHCPCGKVKSDYRAKLCWECHCKSILGKNNYSFFIHGNGYFPYSKEFTKSLKKLIRQRDNYKCQNCGLTQEEHYKKYGRDIEIHHIDYDKMNCNKDNLITLCRSCNSNANFNIDYWYSYYTYIINKD